MEGFYIDGYSKRELFGGHQKVGVVGDGSLTQLVGLGPGIQVHQAGVGRTGEVCGTEDDTTVVPNVGVRPVENWTGMTGGVGLYHSNDHSGLRRR